MHRHLFTESARHSCPYCGERIELIFEPLDEPQNYIEDCQVCCRPIVVQISTDTDAGVDIMLLREDD